MKKLSRYFKKAVTWRVIASLVTMFFLFIITGKVEVTLSYGLIEAIIKVGFYICHEKAWERYNGGK